ncbi:MAG: hypothetical protein Q8N63_02290 [Nanoarchaeota archaeon]|nr:hypothetical protein [Nanoarchaeota archaeon]
MALEFICSKRIFGRRKIALPRAHSNGKMLKYEIDREIDIEIDREKREIAFFYADRDGEDIFALNTWNVPNGARKMKFSVYKRYGQNILNAPVFYDNKGEILKIGNR